MTDGPTVQELHEELHRQALAFNAALAEEQQGHGQALADLAARETDLKAVRELLGEARRELQWLRRAGIDLNAIMDSRAVQALRTVARVARNAVRSVRGGAGR